MTYFLKNIAPAFMWCSVFDLFLMYEQLNWDADWHSFRQRFYQIQGALFASKPVNNRGNLYIRKATT